MPQVPMYSQQVKEQGLPNARFNVDAPLETFGGGASLQAAANAFSGLTDTVKNIGVEIAKEQKKKADEIAKLEAEKQMSEFETNFLYNPETGALNTKGKNSFGLPEVADEALKKKREEVLSNLHNDDQRMAFEKSFALRSADINKQLQMHMSREGLKYDNDVTTSFIDNEQRAAEFNFHDPERIKQSLFNQQKAVLDYADRNGEAPEVVSNKLTNVNSKTHMLVIDRLLANNDDEGARRYFDQATGKTIPGVIERGNIDLNNRPQVKNPDGTTSTVRSVSVNIDGKEVLLPTVSDDGENLTIDEAVAQYKESGKHLGTFKDANSASKYAQELHKQQAGLIGAPYGDAFSSDDRIKVEKALETGTLRIKSQKIADKIIANSPDRMSAMPLVSSMDDSKLKDEVSKRVHQYYSEKKLAVNERKELSYQSASQILEQTKSLDQIPDSLKASFSTTEFKKLEERSRQIRLGIEPVTNWETYTEMRTMATTPETRSKFMQINIGTLRGEMADKEYKELLSMQDGLRKSDPSVIKKLDSGRSDTETINTTLTKNGVNIRAKPGSDGSKQVADYRTKVFEEKANEQQRLGRPLTDAEFQKIVDRQIMKVTTERGWIFDTKKPMYQVTPGSKIIDVDIDSIPKSQRSQIEDAIKKTGKRVTEESVRKIYSSWLERRNK